MDEPRRRAWVGVLRLGLPLGVSAAVHGVLLLLLLGVAWTLGSGQRGTDLGPPVVIALPGPAPAPPAARSSPPTEGVGAATGLTGESPPPTLAGMSVAPPAPAPALRSIAAEGAIPALRAEAVEIGGASFAGLGTRRARSVVYVVDASGAMVTNFKWIKDELQRSVAALSPAQRFQVVLFRDRTGAGSSEVVEVFDPGDGSAGLLPATGANKAALARWLAVVEPVGRSNPLDGLRRGLALAPDVVFLLSRGIRRTGGVGDDPPGGLWGRGAETILAELDRLNPVLRDGGPRTVAVKTIQFLEDDPTGIMRAIADRHGDGEGSYRVVTLRDLGVR